MQAKNLPLKNLKIIAIEQYGAAPFGTMYLADLGAEVIKIENHKNGGEMGRHVLPYAENGDSLFFQTFSANKKSMALDLQTRSGQQILHRISADADAVINNLRGDLPTKLHLDYSSLQKVKKDIVCVHLSAYGRHNSRAAWPGLDYVMQAEAGYLSITGEPNAPPTMMGLSVVDFMGGLTAALALLAGVLGARSAGTGQDYDTSLFDVAMTNLSYPATWHLNEGFEPERVPHSGHPSLVPSEMYKTADGHIFIMANKANFWPRLCEIIKKPDWVHDIRMNDFSARLENRDLVYSRLQSVFIKHTTKYWLTLLEGQLPCAPVNDIKSALSNNFARDQKSIQMVKHPKRGSIQVLRQPILVDGEIVPRQSAPTLGADTLDILKKAGFSNDEISEFESEGVIATASD